MYGYEEYIDITPDQVLQKVSQEDIFEFALQEKFSFNNKYRSPFRVDNNPNCRFERRDDGSILFIDFGEKFLTGRTHRSCFGVVMEVYGVSLTKAIKIILSKFGLSNDSEQYQRPIILERENDKIETTIDYEKKSYTKSDISYWSQFLIRPEHLEEDNVFSAKWFSVRSRKGYRKFTAYSHCYVMDFVDKRKIYQPYSKNYKWITNCDENCIGNIDNLPLSGDELIIQKGYKSHRVLRNLDLGLNVIWFSTEGCIPSEEILLNLFQRFKLITMFYDNDRHGLLAARNTKKQFDSLYPGKTRIVYLPRRQYGWKNVSDFIHKEGRADTIKILKQVDICQI